ncbi:MAG: hypothetical protein KC731_12795, partial [Myxococcales bacterium]|nr:hypothetical protein [Myxococcales bacterium]
MTLTDHPFLAEEQYLLTTVRHELSRGSGEWQYHNTFTAIPFGTPYRPPRVTPRPDPNPDGDE